MHARSNGSGGFFEEVPKKALVVDLIHRAVRRLFDGEGEEAPVAPQVRVINLSIGDPGRPFLRAMSPLARLIDWLSQKYQVLFVISAGNQFGTISLGVSRSELEALSPQEREKLIIRSLYDNLRHRRILSPSESLNALTVGATHQDNAEDTYWGNRIDPFPMGLPSPVSAFGSGYRRSIKPDVLLPGGRVLLIEDFKASSESGKACFKVSSTNLNPPGLKVAHPSSMPGDLGKVAFSRGTSCATALMTRTAAICYDTLRLILQDQTDYENLRTYEAVVLKAMVMHSCEWGDLGSKLRDTLDRQGQNHRRQVKNHVARWAGYGTPCIEKVLNCTAQRATLIGYGALGDDEANIFQLPLPPSLASVSQWRRLTITLAWFSPIAPSSQKYRAAYLWFEPLNNNGLVPNRQERDHNAVKRGTLQHEIFEGDRANPFVDGDTLNIKVNCRKDAGEIEEPVKFGLWVSLEVKEDVSLPIYEEIRTRIAVPVRVQASGEST